VYSCTILYSYVGHTDRDSGAQRYRQYGTGTTKYRYYHYSSYMIVSILYEYSRTAVVSTTVRLYYRYVPTYRTVPYCGTVPYTYSCCYSSFL
jgi:hypothetical protein